MKWKILLFIILIFGIYTVNAIDYIFIDDVKIDSFWGEIKTEGEIYIGSIIRYNISLKNNNTKNFGNQIFNVIIINPSREIIENSTFIVNTTKNSNFFIGSNITEKGWKLIYADVPGIYKLTLNLGPNPGFKLWENKKGAWRNDYSLPFFFEVKSAQDKRWEDTNEELIKRNKEMVDITKKMLGVSIAMLIVGGLSLFSIKEGRKVIIRILLGLLLFLITILLFLFIVTIFNNLF